MRRLNSAGRLTNLLHTGGGNTIANTTYVYDAHNRLTSETRNGTQTSYSYDDTDQLTNDGANSWTFDANGKEVDGTIDWSLSFADANRFVRGEADLGLAFLDRDVLAWFKAHGDGYQTRINRILRVVMESQPPRPTPDDLISN